MIVVEYICLFILLLVTAYACMPNTFYNWFEKLFVKKGDQSEQNNSEDV
ncbi:MAG: hypothetical protein JWN30_2328 [Bacilli bacterium]|nr:hypothetical protein [Bacilli bacterium]